MTRNRWRTTRLVVMLILILTMACSPSKPPAAPSSGGVAGPTPSSGSAQTPVSTSSLTSAGTLDLGDAVPVASATIGPDGGRVEVSSPGDPLDGLIIEVPAGSYEGEVSVTVTSREVQGHSLGPSFNPAAPLIDIRGPETPSDELLTLSIPIEIEEDEFAMAFAYDAGKGEVSGLGLLESTRSKVVAGTWGIGLIRVLVSAIEVEALDGNVDTGFQHGVHDWHIPNFSSYLSPGGVCAGMNLAALYYFLEELGPPLHGRYDNHDNGYVSTPWLWSDDEQALRLASVVQNAIDWDNWAFRFWGAYRHWLNDRMTFRALAYALLATGKPQTVSVRGWDAGGSPVHHSLVCYKKEGTTFFVSDPNFPLGMEGGAEERTITFQDMMSGFQPYRSAAVTGGPPVTFTEVAFWPYQAFLDWSILGQLWDQLERGRVGDSEFPMYELAVRQADLEGWEELLPNYESKSKDIVVRARDADFTAILHVRDANGQVLGTNTQVDIELQDGDNWLGFEVLGGIQEGDSVWLRWVGFDWIKVIHEPPVAVAPSVVGPGERLQPSPEIPAGTLVWVRQEPPVVNVNKEPKEFKPPESRYAGSVTKMIPSETMFTTQEVYVDNGSPWYDLTIKCSFDTPPPVLVPGRTYPITATMSHEGTHTQGGEGLGEQFWYAAQRGYEEIVDPRAVLPYYPWNPNFGGTDRMVWTVTGPAAAREGETFDLYAGLWNRPPCNVSWTYRAEFY